MKTDAPPEKLDLMSYARSIAIICSLFAAAALLVLTRGQSRVLAAVAILCALCLPLLAHCRCSLAVIRLASSRYPERWRKVLAETGARAFLFDSDDLGDSEIRTLKRRLKIWGWMFGGTLIAALVFVALVASHYH